MKNSEKSVMKRGRSGKGGACKMRVCAHPAKYPAYAIIRQKWREAVRQCGSVEAAKEALTQATPKMTREEIEEFLKEVGAVIEK